MLGDVKGRREAGKRAGLFIGGIHYTLRVV